MAHLPWASHKGISHILRSLTYKGNPCTKGLFPQTLGPSIPHMQHLAYLRQQTEFACFSSSSAKKQKTQRLHQPGSWALAPWTAGLRQTFNLIHSLWNLLAFTNSASLPSCVLQSLSSMEPLDRYNYMKSHKSSGSVAFRKWPQTLRSASNTTATIPMWLLSTGNMATTMKKMNAYLI